jgi:hypothetical protein
VGNLNHFCFRWKWSIKQPIIAGRKRRSLAEQSGELIKKEVIGDLLEEAYSKIVKSLEDQRLREEENYNNIFDEENPDE